MNNKPRYKLIKTYPNSPELGHTLMPKLESYYGNGKPFNPEDYPENWKLIDEKDYEILSIVSEGGGEIGPYYKSGDNFTDRTGCWHITSFPNGNHGCVIHSVKRLSDREVFTLGDHILRNGNTTTIKSFEINTYWSGGLSANQNEKPYGGECISTLEKCSKTPVFTTEDGVDIYEGDTYWFVVEGDSPLLNTWTAIKDVANWGVNNHKPPLGYTQFSTRYAAEDYIIRNKPCLSVNDVMNKIVLDREDISDLEDLVREKL